MSLVASARRGHIDATHVIRRLRWLDTNLQPFESRQIRNCLNVTDKRGSCFTKLEVQHASNTLNQPFDASFSAAFLDTNFFDTGDVGHLPSLLVNHCNTVETTRPRRLLRR